MGRDHLSVAKLILHVRVCVHAYVCAYSHRSRAFDGYLSKAI